MIRLYHTFRYRDLRCTATSGPSDPFDRITGTQCAIWFMPELDAPNSEKLSPFRQACNILELMDTNDWNQVDVAKHLEISRARVTQILNVLKIPKEKIDRMKKEGVRIMERRLQDL